MLLFFLFVFGEKGSAALDIRSECIDVTKSYRGKYEYNFNVVLYYNRMRRSLYVRFAPVTSI